MFWKLQREAETREEYREKDNHTAVVNSTRGIIPVTTKPTVVITRITHAVAVLFMGIFDFLMRF